MTKRLWMALGLVLVAAIVGAQGIEYKPASGGSSIDLTAATTLGTAYGADMVTNGTFTGNATGWTLGLGGGAPDWAYSSNTVTHANGGGTATLEPSTPLTVVAGRTYRVTFTLSSLTAGTVTASIGGASATAASVNGTYVHTLVATDTTNLKFTPTTTLVATIDTISVVESKAVTIANLTAGRVPFATTGGRVTDSASFLADDSAGGDGVFTVRKTMSGGSVTSNFFNVTGTTPTTMAAQTVGALFLFSGAGTSSQVLYGTETFLGSGYTGSSKTGAIFAPNQSAGTGTMTTLDANPGGNFGVEAEATATTTGNNTGGFFRAGGGNTSVGVIGKAAVNKASGVNIGGWFHAANASGGAVFNALVASLGGPNISSLVNAAALIDNGNSANPILILRDNAAALPTTGATATITVQDGAWPQLGNGVLTSGTATAETQARMSGSQIHSCTWTNAQVVALGAALTGDISCFTLPAKTVVKNVYLIITGQGAGTTTLTAAVGRVSAGYIDYIVASDAKAAANTVYGDASGERGTNLTGYDLPSYTGTTVVNIHFISTGANLDQVTGSTGRAILETALVP